MDDIYSIRRKNLASLCADEESQSAMARTLDQNPSLINRYLRGKNIGDDFARAVEKAYKLEVGWMDNVHPTEREQLVLRAYRTAAPVVQEALERALGIAKDTTGSSAKRRVA